MRTIKVLLCDPQPMSRQLLQETLLSMKGLSLCAVTTDPWELPELCADHQPELLIADPGLEIPILRGLKQDYPLLRIIVLTSLRFWELPGLLQELGVQSLIYRQEAPLPLSGLIERTLAGQSVWPEALPQVRIGLATGEDFTPRETDVLRYLLEGCSDSVIARQLGISAHAVHYHVNNMLSKTGFSSRIKLAVMVRHSDFVMSAEEYRNMK